MKRPHLQITGVEEEEDSQDNDMAQVFNKVLEEKFPKLNQKILIQVLEAYRTPHRQNQKRNSPGHIIVKIQDVQSKERIVSVAKEKQVTYKGKTYQNCS